VSKTWKRNIQGRGPFCAELAMEDENGLSGSISADRRFRLKGIGAQKKLFDSSGRIDIESARDMTTVVLVIKPAVNDVV